MAVHSLLTMPLYTVMGFAPTKYGLAILGRASQKQVVNVAQRGGLCGVMLGHSASQARTSRTVLDTMPLVLAWRVGLAGLFAAC